MSTAPTARREGSPYNHGNWWFHQHQPGQDSPTSGHDRDRPDPNDPGYFIAHAIRKARHRVVCGWCYQYGEEIELSEPTLYVGDTAGELRHARRYNPETGHLNWGEGTWTRIPDGSLEDLLADLDLWFAMSDRPLRDSERQALRQLVRRQKKQQFENGLSDTQILKNAVDRVRSPGPIDE